jgi:Fe-S-cluster containining protein
VEIDLDINMIRQLVGDETRQASDDIARSGPLQAYRQSLQRHDARLAAAPDVDTLDCKQGCAWCCYFTVDARPVEVLNIIETMQQTLPVAEQKRILREATANSAKLSGLPNDARIHQNLKCPFLLVTASGGHCGIYQARPQTCRNYHATNVNGCKQSFDQPSNEDIDPDFAPLVYQTGHAHVDAFSHAMQTAGYDTRAYELNSAITHALASPETLVSRFENKQNAFFSLEGEDVPADFIDV